MIKRSLGHLILRVNGWRWHGDIPETPRFVLIAAPHTSNWDLVYMLAFSWITGVKLSWMGKHTLFQGWRGAMLRRLGGVPIDRRSPQGMVGQMVDLYEQRERFVLAIPPEGTRKLVPRWKSGFYHIARGANVPIVMGYLDYARKEGGFGPSLLPTDDLRADMDALRAFYQDKQARYPEKMGAVRLREEETEVEG